MWCNYIKGECEFANNAFLCDQQSHVACRIRREKIEAKQPKGETT